VVAACLQCLHAPLARICCCCCLLDVATLITLLLAVLLQDARTPLYLATLKGHKEVVVQLLRAGAAMDAVNDVGLSTLLCTWGHLHGIAWCRGASSNS
jgi:ankyrin repeat protein